MQNQGVLQAQIESLKEIINVLENTSADQVTKQWRAKVYEELVKNKQQQLLHASDLKKFKEEERRFRLREQELRASLDSAHSQLNSSVLEKQKLNKEVHSLQQKFKNSLFNSGVLMNLQTYMNAQLDTLTRVLALLETYNHKLAFSLNRLKTVKMLQAKDKFIEKNKVIELHNQLEVFKNQQQEIFPLYKEMEAENHRLKHECSNLNYEIENMRKNIEDFHQNQHESKGKLSEEINFKDKEISSLKEELLSLTEHTRVIQEQNSHLKTQCEDIKAEFNLKFQDFQKEMSLLQHEVSSKDQQNTSLKDELRALVMENEKAIQNHEIKVEKLKNQLTEQNNQLTFYKDQEQGYQSELESQEQQFILTIKKLESQIRELKRDRDILFESLHKSEKKPEVIKTPLRTPQSRLDSLEALSKEILDFK